MPWNSKNNGRNIFLQFFFLTVHEILKIESSMLKTPSSLVPYKKHCLSKAPLLSKLARHFCLPHWCPKYWDTLVTESYESHYSVGENNRFKILVLHFINKNLLTSLGRGSKTVGGLKTTIHFLLYVLKWQDSRNKTTKLLFITK